MKNLIILLGVIIGASAASKKYSPEYYTQVKTDIDDIVAVIPWDDVSKVLVDHLENDLEMQAALNYMKSKKFKHSLKSLMTEPSTLELHAKFLKAGFDLEHYERILGEIFGAAKFSIPEETDRSLEGFLIDFAELIPFDALMEVFEEKFNSSESFLKFYRMITGEDVCTMLKRTMHSQEFNAVGADLQSMDAPIYVTLDVLFYTFLECTNGLDILELVFDSDDSDVSL